VRVAALNFDHVNKIWLNVVESKYSRTIFYLFFTTSGRIANIEKVPIAFTPSEIEDNPIAFLMSKNTWSIKGTTPIWTSHSTLASG
jgi:hypothetical protein